VNNGAGAVTGLIEGSTITMDFDAMGQVRGQAGCNSYSAYYQASGNALSVNLPTSTNMYCESPEGVMQQEQQFLTALQSAETFQITGDQIQIRSAGDTLAIMATRAP
jgi:heat shock protein HslJ